MDVCFLVPDALRSAFGYNPGVTNPPAPHLSAPDSPAAAPPKRSRRVFSFDWLRDATPPERSSLIAGGLGWMLDAMDVMLYSMVLANLLDALHMSKETGGLLIGLTLGASAIGGVFFGFVRTASGARAP